MPVEPVKVKDVVRVEEHVWHDEDTLENLSHTSYKGSRVSGKGVEFTTAPKKNPILGSQCTSKLY